MKLRNMLMAGALALGALSAPAASFATATPIFAEGTTEADSGNKVTIKAPTDKEGHTYKVYQLFTGDVSTNGNAEKVITNIVWGLNGKGVLGTLVKEAVIEHLQEISVAPETERSAAIQKYLNEESAPVATLKNGQSKSDLLPGYYVIVDETDNNNSHTASILLAELTGGQMDIKPKDGEVSFTKKVKDTDDTKGEMSGWEDSADYDFGDFVPFQLKATLPDNFDHFKTYKMVFHDSYSADAFEAPDMDSIHVFVNGIEVAPDGYAVNTQAETSSAGNEILHAFTLTIENLKSVKDKGGKEIKLDKHSTITVEYAAQLKNTADIGDTKKNRNVARLEFSNNPEKEDSTGFTPEDTVRVFSFELKVTKLNSEEQPLTGAEFTLYKTVKNGNGEPEYIKVKESAGDLNADGSLSNVFTFKGLDAGEYHIRETKVPEGYAPIDSITFVITAEHESAADDPSLTSFDVAAVKKDDFGVGNGTVSTTILNFKQGSLPSTGGMGTTLLYGAGAVLVAGAGIALVTKKRMSKED